MEFEGHGCEYRPVQCRWSGMGNVLRVRPGSQYCHTHTALLCVCSCMSMCLVIGWRWVICLHWHCHHPAVIGHHTSVHTSCERSMDSFKPLLCMYMHSQSFVRKAYQLPFANNISSSSSRSSSSNNDKNVLLKKIWKSVNIWRRYGQKFAAYFFGPPCMYFVLWYKNSLFARTVSECLCLFWMCCWKKFENRLIFGEDMDKSTVL